MLKKASLAALCAVLSLAALSCGSQEPAPAETGAVPSSSSPSESEPASEPESLHVGSLPEPELPEMDYGGESYLVYGGKYTGGADGSSGVLFPCSMFIEPENLTGEIVNDTVYNRNLKIKEKYNIAITGISSSMAPDVLVQAGEPFDLILYPGEWLAGATYTGAYMNMKDVPYLSLDADYWYPNYSRGLVVDDKVMFMPSEICLDPLMQTTLLYFNKRLFAENDLESPYELVDSGEWTVDRFLGMVKQVHADVNGDGEMTLDDLYGVQIKTEFRYGMIFQLYFGAGQTFTRTDPDAGRVIDIDGELTQSLIDKVRDVFKDETVTYEHVGYDFTDYRNAFLGGHSLFCQDEIIALDSYREMEDDFGVLPIPKYNAEQEAYYHRVWVGVSMFAVPVTAPDLDRTGIIAEYMAWMSHETVVPAYYEITIQQKRTRDPRDIDMLEIIRGSLTFDFADVYDVQLAHYFWDAYSFGSYANRVGSSLKYLKKRMEKYVKMIRGLD